MNLLYNHKNSANFLPQPIQAVDKNTIDWVIYKQQKFYFSQFWRLEVQYKVQREHPVALPHSRRGQGSLWGFFFIGQ